MHTAKPANHLSPSSCAPHIAPRDAVAFVDATADVLGILESTLERRYCNVLLLDSRAHAHAEIKRLRPRLVVVCTSFERPESFQFLTMLKLDAATRHIPLVTLAGEECDAEEHEDDAAMLDFPLCVPANASPSPS